MRNRGIGALSWTPSRPMAPCVSNRSACASEYPGNPRFRGARIAYQEHGDDVEVLAPDSLRSDVAATLTRALRRYEGAQWSDDDSFSP